MSNYNDVHLSQDEMVGTAGMVPRALLDHQGHQEYQVGEIQNHNIFSYISYGQVFTHMLCHCS